MANQNPNADVLAIGGSIATVGIGAQVPALSGLASYAIGAFSSTFIAGSVNAGVSIASSAIGIVGAPVLIVGGLALVGYELLRD